MMRPGASESGPANVTSSSDITPSKKKKKNKKKSSDLRYARFRTEASALVEGLVPEKHVLPDGSIREWEFDKCYLITDIGKVGRLSAIGDVDDDSDLPADLPRYRSIV